MALWCVTESEAYKGKEKQTKCERENQYRNGSFILFFFLFLFSKTSQFLFLSLHHSSFISSDHCSFFRSSQSFCRSLYIKIWSSSLSEWVSKSYSWTAGCFSHVISSEFCWKHKWKWSNTGRPSYVTRI